MPIFVFIVIFALWALYEMRKSSAADQKRSDEFWEQERTADNVRRQDISKLNYVTIPFQELPFREDEKEPIKTYQNNIYELKDSKILNLTGYTNTELKLQYGAANLTDLTEYDTNFTKLVSNLARWGEECFKQGNITDAKTIFEYGIQIQTDVSSNYIILGQIYLAEGNSDKIYELIEQAEDIRSIMKDSIVKRLHQLLEQDI